MSNRNEKINVEGFTLLGALLGLFAELYSNEEKEFLEIVRRRRNSKRFSDNQKEVLVNLAAKVVVRLSEQNQDLVIKEQ